jgi:hypothetical protein
LNPSKGLLKWAEKMWSVSDSCSPAELPNKYLYSFKMKREKRKEERNEGENQNWN